MCRTFSPLIIIVVSLVIGCDKEPTTQIKASSFHGKWVREEDVPGRQPADTLHFFTKAGKDMLFFHFSSTAGAITPTDVETEYKFENGKLSLRDFSGGTNDFVPVESFEWITAGKEFRAKLYQIVHFMSADYRVSYHKIN